MAEDIEKYEYLWVGGAEGHWILLKDKKGACLPYHVVKRTVLLIEDDEASFAVVDRMLKAGVKVFDQPPPSPGA